MSDDRAAFESWGASMGWDMTWTNASNPRFLQKSVQMAWLARQEGMRAGIERAAEVCEEVADRHRANNDRTWPERNRSEGQDGASDCEAAIRALLEGKG